MSPLILQCYNFSQKLNLKKTKQAQESLAAAVSLNSSVIYWAGDRIKKPQTLNCLNLQQATKNETCNLYPFTFAFKGKLLNVRSQMRNIQYPTWDAKVLCKFHTLTSNFNTISSAMHD